VERGDGSRPDRRGHHAGGFESYFRELGELLAASQAEASAGPGAHLRLHESDAFAKLAEKYQLTYGNPSWLEDVVAVTG
jgi:hypothetical protein